MVYNHICSPYGLVIFEDKGHMCKVVAAILISTNPPFIPGINNFYLWSLAPVSTRVRLRLKRAATESSCQTGVKSLVTLPFNYKLYRISDNLLISEE